MKKSLVIGAAVGVSILVLSYAIARIAPLSPTPAASTATAKNITQ